MKTNLNTSLICLVIIFVRAGQPLKCWSCSSIIESRCDDPFKPEDLSAGSEYLRLSECYIRFNGSYEERLMDHIFGPDAKEYCKKTVRQMYGVTVVYRGCAIGDISKDCPDSSPNDCHSEACYEDGCNAAARLGLSLMFLTLLMLCCLF